MTLSIRNADDFLLINHLFVDACSLIILEKSNTLTCLEAAFSISSIIEIQNEVLSGSVEPDKWERFFSNVTYCQSNDKLSLTDEKFVKAGEIFLRSNKPLSAVILTDDKKVMKRFKQQNGFFINALLIPVILYLKNRLERQQAKLLMDEIILHGRYTPQVITYAMSYL